VWSYQEYQKLRDYDEITPLQPMATFACHATPDHHCHGWAVCHTNRGNEYDLIALRIWPPEGEIPEAAVPLFASGNEAADHGQRDVTAPSREAVETADRLVRKYERLQRG
jgi:hypothetical protein